MIRKFLLSIALISAASTAAKAQGATQSPTAKKSLVSVCAKGVQIFTDIKEVPKPYDSVTVPMPAEPVRITNEDELAAAEVAMRGRAGSVGATGVVITDETTDNGSGMMQMRRSLQGVYVASDSARAQKACGK